MGIPICLLLPPEESRDGQLVHTWTVFSPGREDEDRRETYQKLTRSWLEVVGGDSVYACRNYKE